MKKEDLIFRSLTILAAIGATICAVFLLIQSIKAFFLVLYVMMMNPITTLLILSIALIGFSYYFVVQDNKRKENV